MDNCVFCKIARGEIEDLRIWEDENYVAFLDINPFVVGHTLVIPKKHTRWIWEIGDTEYLDYMRAVKKIAELLKKTFDTDCANDIETFGELVFSKVCADGQCARDDKGIQDAKDRLTQEKQMWSDTVKEINNFHTPIRPPTFLSYDIVQF